MNKVEKVLALVEKSLKEVEAEIKSYETDKGDCGTLRQLRYFQIDLETILEQLQDNKLPPRDKRKLGIGYTIIDSWDGDRELGNLLLSVEQAYRNL